MAKHRHLNWISLSKLDTSKVFASTHSLPMGGARVDWIIECVRHEFECFEDDEIELTEGDDGRELVTINGTAVIEIHNAYIKGYVAGLTAKEAA